MVVRNYRSVLLSGSKTVSSRPDTSTTDTSTTDTSPRTYISNRQFPNGQKHDGHFPSQTVGRRYVCLRMGGVGGGVELLALFCGRHICMTPNTRHAARFHNLVNTHAPDPEKVYVQKKFDQARNEHLIMKQMQPPTMSLHKMLLVRKKTFLLSYRKWKRCCRDVRRQSAAHAAFRQSQMSKTLYFTSHTCYTVYKRSNRILIFGTNDSYAYFLIKICVMESLTSTVKF